MSGTGRTCADDPRPDPEGGGRTPFNAIDYVLGEGDQDGRAAFRSELEEDLGLAVEVAEVRDLFERCAEIGADVVPTGRVEREVHRAWRRRNEIFRRTGLGWRERVGVALRVAAVALISLAVGWTVFAVAERSHRDQDGLAGLERVFDLPGMPPLTAVGSGAAGSGARSPRADPELVTLLADDALPIDDAPFVAETERFAALPIPTEFHGLLSAENRLALLRAESRLRFSAQLRAAVRAATGAPDLDDRVERLAAEVAAQVPTAISGHRETGGIEAISFALRALVAAGSSTDVGPHRDSVRVCRAHLLAALDDADRGGRATILAGLSELAVLGDATVSRRIAAEADQLARATLRRRDDGARPALVNWSTPVHELADAGRVFWIAPAFGTHAGLAFRARLMIAAHISERLEARVGSEQPDLLAAQLHGFGDLIVRSDAERRLSLWRPRLLYPDFVAMHHVAWSKYPVRPGWAEFQRELRGIAAMPTPPGLRDRAALLLSLCTNFAAPGSGGRALARSS